MIRSASPTDSSFGKAALAFWRRHRLLLLVPLLLLVAFGAWAVSSPVGSSPDDDLHLPSIWCAQGDHRPGFCLPNGDSTTTRLVPAPVENAACFRGDGNKSGDCQNWTDTTMVVAGRVNAAGGYPPLFYLVDSVFVSHDVEASVVTMRLFNALLFILLATGLYLLLPHRHRTTLVLALAVSVIPMGMFIIASTNPSGWATAGCGLLWLALLGFYESVGWRRWVLAGIAAAATLMAAGSRADTAVYAALSVIAVIFLSARRGRGFWNPVNLAFPAALVVVCYLFYASAFTGQALAMQGHLTDLHGLSLFAHNLLEVPSLWAGSLGTWGLGWIDTPMPTSVWVTGLLIFGAVVFAGLRAMVWRKAVTLIALLALMIALPVYQLQRQGLEVGTNLQPRYFLPLVVLLAGLALLAVGGRSVRLARSQALVVVIGLSVANAVALYTNLRRYTVPGSSMTTDLDASRWWWPQLVPPPLAVLTLGSLAFAAALAALVYWSNALRPEREQPFTPAPPVPVVAP